MAVNFRYKDSVFSFLFGNPDTLRELYGAIEGVTLPPDIPVTINTLEGVLFRTKLNDISFEIGGKVVVLIEHQSTINPNMPLRLLMYIARVYEKIIGPQKIYGSKKRAIPRPEFIVLYNGASPFPDETVMKLSESFEDASSLGIGTDTPAALELTAKVYNINHGRNSAIVKRCEALAGYSAFIAKVRELETAAKGGGEATEEEHKAAMAEAVNWCIAHGILKQFLEAHGSEVVNMLYEEWDMDTALAVEHDEGREERELEIARNALAKGLSPDIISEITGLDMENIRRLAAH